MEKQKPDFVTIKQFDNQQFPLHEYLLKAVLEWQQECNGDAFNLETTPAELLDDLIKVSNNGVLYVAESKDGKCIGFTGVVIFKNPLGTEMIANEHYWYVIKKYRTGLVGYRLLRAAMNWSKEQGCTHFIANASNLASDMHDKAALFYKRIGMRLFACAVCLFLSVGCSSMGRYPYRGHIHITMQLADPSQKEVSHAHVEFGEYRSVGTGLSGPYSATHVSFNRPLPDKARVVFECEDGTYAIRRVPVKMYEEALDEYDLTFIFSINSNEKTVQLKVEEYPIKEY